MIQSALYRQQCFMKITYISNNMEYLKFGNFTNYICVCVL